MFLSKYRLNIAMLRIGKHRIVKWKSPTPTIVPDQNSTLTGARMSARPRECGESFPCVRRWAEARDHHHGVRGQQESSPLACREAGEVSRQRLAVGRRDLGKLAFFLAVGGQSNPGDQSFGPLPQEGSLALGCKASQCVGVQERRLQAWRLWKLYRYIQEAGFLGEQGITGGHPWVPSTWVVVREGAHRRLWRV